MSDDEGWGLVLPFDTDEPEFCRGFEAGQIWEQLQRGDDIDRMIHAENSEMVMRMCEKTGREFRAEDVGDDWMHLQIGG